jgi:hypothetical protein
MIWIPNETDVWEEIGVASIVFFAGHSYANADMLDSLNLKIAGSYNDYLARYFGDLITSRKKAKRVYGIAHTTEAALKHREKLPFELGLFQNRKKPTDKPDAEIIKQSTRLLAFWAQKWERIVLEFPGGAPLADKDVLKILAVLPENVYVYNRNRDE